MGMKTFPVLHDLGGGRTIWTHTFDTFYTKVYVPAEDPFSGMINFGFKAPYFLVFEEQRMSEKEAVAFAESCGLASLAQQYATSVVFVYPTASGGWPAATVEMFQKLISESKIHQYYNHGAVTFKDRFTKQWGDCFIRGAIFRTFLFGFGSSADYIATHLMTAINGEYLWGPGDITPTAVILQNLSVVPDIGRNDIPVMSVGNSEKINNILKSKCQDVIIRDTPDYINDLRDSFLRYKRWCGSLEKEVSMSELHMIEKPGVVTVHTSGDNCGDYAGTEEHPVGYVAYCRDDLSDLQSLPTLLVFHGGGDSAFYISEVSGWYRVACRHRFLLIAVEDHMNTTASETVELIELLKKEYPIDPHRIYASGFSMGGCKCWDLYQEYPLIFAALAPMDATFDVGLNVYGKPAPTPINHCTPVPLYYAAGEATPLPELPCQARKCWDRMRYVFEVNRIEHEYSADFDRQSEWPDPLWGESGDIIEKSFDGSRQSILTEHHFRSADGVYRTVFSGISGQGHECREHTCEHAWRFMARFTR